MKINIDGITINTNSFMIEFKNGQNTTCGSIDILSFQSEAVILYYLYFKIN